MGGKPGLIKNPMPSLITIFFAGAYISETVHATHRNTLNSIQIVMVGLGSLFALVLGYLLDWRTIAYVLAAVSFVASTSILCLPETPYYLIEKGGYVLV